MTTDNLKMLIKALKEYAKREKFYTEIPIEPFLDEFIRNGIELLGLFGLADIGVPFEETPAFNQAILNVLEEYSISEIEDSRELLSYPNFINIARDTGAKYTTDPRFEDYFESAKRGVFR